MPVLTAKGRGGTGMTFALSYNSQMWRKNGTTIWNYGVDTGYGHGWCLMAGSVTPVWADSWNIEYLEFRLGIQQPYRRD